MDLGVVLSNNPRNHHDIPHCGLQTLSFGSNGVRSERVCSGLSVMAVFGLGLQHPHGKYRSLSPFLSFLPFGPLSRCRRVFGVGLVLGWFV